MPIHSHVPSRASNLDLLLFCIACSTDAALVAGSTTWSPHLRPPTRMLQPHRSRPALCLPPASGARLGLVDHSLPSLVGSEHLCLCRGVCAGGRPSAARRR
ncbi:uncharacterized protein J3D65DRAFT_620594 [Phyllosticta citribraziliensis]|uniref:Secreted protein n=1 Tax=Phyllosticta citribraziliensis TaxID=989973 RepID=A0ABR1LZV3_9PEZI